MEIPVVVILSFFVLWTLIDWKHIDSFGVKLCAIGSLGLLIHWALTKGVI